MHYHHCILVNNHATVYTQHYAHQSRRRMWLCLGFILSHLLHVLLERVQNLTCYKEFLRKWIRVVLLVLPTQITAMVNFPRSKPTPNILNQPAKAYARCIKTTVWQCTKTAYSQCTKTTYDVQKHLTDNAPRQLSRNVPKLTMYKNNLLTMYQHYLSIWHVPDNLIKQFNQTIACSFHFKKSKLLKNL